MKKEDSIQKPEKQSITTNRRKLKKWLVDLEHDLGESAFNRIELGCIYLLIDCSGSMSTGDKLTQARTGSIQFAKDAWKKGYSTGLIKFGSTATLICEPQNDVLVLEQYIKGMVAGGSTNMTEAILLATQRLSKVPEPHVIVIATDGYPDDEIGTLKAAIEAKKKGIEIIAIGTDDADSTFLKKLASRTELGIQVPKKDLDKGIASAATLLPLLRSGKKGNIIKPQ